MLVVTSVHTPLDARIHHRQIRALVDAGIEVAYAAPWTATGTPPESAVAGVRTLDLPRASGRRRLRALLAARRLLARHGRSVDVILLHDPELLLTRALVPGRLAPVVFDVHEDLAASLADRGWIPRRLRGFAVRAATWLERAAARWCAELLLAEEGYRARFPTAHPVVPNLPWLPTSDAPAGRDRRVVYLGRISAGRGARELIAMAQALAQPRDGRDPIGTELIGPVDRDVRDEIQRAHDRGELTWHGFTPNDVALDRIAGAIAGLSPLHDLPNYRVSLPTKIVEYLAIGLPAITTPLPAAAALVERTAAGTVVPFGDVEALVQAVVDLDDDRERLARCSANGRAYVRDNHSWDGQATAFVEHLREVARGNGAPRA